MCLAIPGRLTAIEGGEGVVDYGGVTRRAELMLTPEARVGMSVLVHAGFVIAVLDEQKGEELMRLAAETASFAPPKEAGSDG